MLPKIAWRNVWRSRARSFVVIGAVLLGVWAFITMISFSLSLTKNYVDDAIRFQTSHIQIHHPDFEEDKGLQFLLDEKVFDKAKSQPSVQVAARRTIVNGMIKSSRGARGITIKGVEPEEELTLTTINEKLIEGRYFQKGKTNEILISTKMAEKLKLKLRKKVVLQFQDFKGDITAGSFRIVGLFNTGNTVADLGMVMVNRSDINRILGNENTLHEIAIQLKNASNDLESAQENLVTSLPNTMIKNYRQISPDIQLYESQIYISVSVLLFIFMLALVFGILNTMLMAVLERTKELGMLMAVGMSKGRVFLMIVLETIMLGLVGAPLGLGAGWLTVRYLNKTGIDLGGYAEGFERFGLSTMIRPELETELYFILMVAVFFTALLASLYPAYRAIKLKPMEAIRKI